MVNNKNDKWYITVHCANTFIWLEIPKFDHHVSWTGNCKDIKNKKIGRNMLQEHQILGYLIQYEPLSEFNPFATIEAVTHQLCITVYNDSLVAEGLNWFNSMPAVRTLKTLESLSKCMSVIIVGSCSPTIHTTLSIPHFTLASYATLRNLQYRNHEILIKYFDK